ncbi:MAG: holin [Ottowia sp.]|uniref:holin n=1 Tax=Ottowia sp. TaxID=1898956 RepID=UPI0039E6FCB2
MKTEAAELAVASAASKSTYAGALSMVLGWLTSNEAAVLVGMLVGVVGLWINFYYKAKADRRAEALYQARLGGAGGLPV